MLEWLGQRDVGHSLSEVKVLHCNKYSSFHGGSRHEPVVIHRDLKCRSLNHPLFRSNSCLVLGLRNAKVRLR